MVQHAKLEAWVEEVAAMCQPDRVHWCDGSPAEYQADAAADGPGGHRHLAGRSEAPQQHLRPLRSRRTWPASRTAPSSARRRKEDAGPTNNWADPDEMKTTLTELFAGCMRGRTMYVIPYSMGPVGSPIAKIGVELTDSPYVVANMHIMTRVGNRRCSTCSATDGDFVRGLHSVGAPLGAERAGLAVALQRARTSTSPTSPRPARSGRSAPATAATRCSARSATRCASPRSRRATRAGWPSTCSSSSSPARRAR